MDDTARLYLETMGIQVWELRAQDVTALPASAPPEQEPPPAELPAAVSEPPPLDSVQIPEEYEEWASMVEVEDNDNDFGLEAPPEEDRDGRIARMDWDQLQAEASACTACELHASRTQAVFGVGNHQARWMIIGEAPGADEDRLGEPFVGRAGKLLDAMLLALGLQREQVFIANILKCRPPKNRDPQPQEARCCWPFLERQITLIKPGIILAVGRIAAQNLLQTEVQVGKLRGRVFRLQKWDIPVVITYHPAYLLRSPREKRKAWDDLQLARRTLVSESGDSSPGVGVA